MIWTWQRTNYIKANIDNMPQNSKCRLFGDRTEMVYYIISKCNKLAQKEYKSKHDWLVKVIHWELCKRLKFDHMDYNNIYLNQYLWENETCKILWEGLGDTKWIAQSRLESLTINWQEEKYLSSSRFCCSSRTYGENESRQKEKTNLGSCQMTEETIEHESYGDSNCSWCTWNSSKVL